MTYRSSARARYSRAVTCEESAMNVSFHDISGRDPWCKRVTDPFAPFGIDFGHVFKGNGWVLSLLTHPVACRRSVKRIFVETFLRRRSVAPQFEREACRPVHYEDLP